MNGVQLPLVLSIILIFDLTYGEGNMKETSQSFKKSSQGEVDLNYLLYFPDEYESSRKNYPLVLFLHGAGERGDD